MRRARPDDPACSAEQIAELDRMLRLAVDVVPDSRRRARACAALAEDLMALPDSVVTVAERESKP